MADNTLYERLELSRPGSWVAHDDRDYAWTVNRLLSDAVDQFNCALVACQFFEPVFGSRLPPGPTGAVLPWHDPIGGHLRGVFARAYVYALDATGRFVQALQNQPNSAEPAISACASFLDHFKDIRAIRNSLAHIDERSQGRGKGGKKLPGPVIILGSFIGNQGNRFGVTSEDGRQVYVEISEGFLKGYRSMLEDVIWSFEWTVIGGLKATRPERKAGG